MPKVASSVGRGRPVAPPRPGFDSRVERISGPWGKKIPSSVFISKAWFEVRPNSQGDGPPCTGGAEVRGFSWPAVRRSQ